MARRRRPSSASAPATGEAATVELVRRLLEGATPTLKLLRHNPFPDRPPAVVRARLYHYRFTSRAERRETGAWWARTPVALWLPPLALDTSGALTASATDARRRTPT